MQITRGIEKAAPEFDDNKGVSLVLVNNEAGEKAFEKVKEEADLEADKARGQYAAAS